jgi:preprotein translocase subunit SecF
MALLNRTFDFIGVGRKLSIMSAIAVLVSIGSLLINSLEFGLDFTSGSLVEVGYSESVDVAEVGRQLSAAGYDEAQVVAFGSDQEVLIRMPVDESLSEVEMASQLVVLGENLLSTLQEGTTAEVEIRRMEFVGPRWGFSRCSAFSSI